MSRWICILWLLSGTLAPASLPKSPQLAAACAKRGQLQFDAANRLTNTVTPLNRQTWQVWNNRGLLSAVRDPMNQWTTNYYDARARLTNRTDQTGVRTYAYDANNNLTNAAEGGRANTWTFDAYDRVNSYRDADGNLVQYPL